MKRRMTILVVLGTLIALVPLALAQGGAPPAAAMPKPAAQLSQLKYFGGSFRCKGQAFASPYGPAHPTEATVHVALELDGFWYTGRYTEKKTQQNTHPYEFDFSWGYDAATEKFLAAGHDNMGGSATQTSSGWEGDRMVWDGETLAMGQKAGARDTFIKKGPDELQHTGEMQLNGQWTKLDEETCTRAAAKKK